MVSMYPNRPNCCAATVYDIQMEKRIVTAVVAITLAGNAMQGNAMQGNAMQGKARQSRIHQDVQTHKPEHQTPNTEHSNRGALVVRIQSAARYIRTRTYLASA